jgi:hypothetical protein
MKTVNFLRSLSLVVGLYVAAIAVTSQSLFAQTLQFQVDAGAYDRQNTVVEFQLPMALEPGVYQLHDANGSELSFQVDFKNRGWFILDLLPAGTTARFELHHAADKATTGNSAGSKEAEHLGVTLEMDSSTLTLATSATPVLTYYHSENSPPPTLDNRYRRGGYIHPVYSPTGLILTNHLNVNQHPHHSGIWSAWTRTSFEGRTPDFWNVHSNSGRVDVDTLLHFWDGPVVGGLVASHKFIDLSSGEAVVALNELWEVSVYSMPSHQGFLVFDMTVTQTANTGRPLKLPEYRYGGIGFRGHPDWNDPEKSNFLTSDGLGRDGHGTRARWAHMGGHTGGKQAGMAILGHPTNYRFPQPMRIHPTEPFFNFAPTQLGDMEILPGMPHVTRLRIVTHDGEPDPALIDRLWNDYAYPPAVTVLDRFD